MKMPLKQSQHTGVVFYGEHVFDVESGKPEKVFDKWMETWGKDDLDKTFLCNFEEYKASGEITVHVGALQ